MHKYIYYSKEVSELKVIEIVILWVYYTIPKGVGEGGQGGTSPPPHFQKWGGGHKCVCAPPPLLGSANVLISLFAHILWLKTHFFSKIFLARFARQF